MLIHLESVQIVGISLKSHQQPSEGHVGGQTGSLIVRFVTFDPVDLSIHHVLEAVRPRSFVLKRIILPTVWAAILPQSGSQDQAELVAQLHGVQPRVDVQDQVHFEGLGLAVKAGDSVELLALRVHILNVEYILKEYASHYS